MFELSDSRDVTWGETVFGSQMLFGLHGKVAVVTGGGRGLGAAVAETFARAGASVVLLDVAGEYARAKADHIRSFGGIAHAISCDVTDDVAVRQAFDKVVREFGGLDVLVNNAGRAVRKPAMDLSLDEWQSVIDLNLTAVFACSRTAARHMKAHGGGAIVNLASVMGLSGGLFPNASYQASKGGVVNLTRALALEWAADNIRVNAVAPTYVQTELTAAVFSSPEAMEAIMAHTPLKRLPEPEDIAAAILYLASPAAHCVTGVVLPVDSGFLAR
jgi:NAD(P)-dependent dehydrogenase (short-subunit alcohol dehydrogenase family)